MRGWLASWGRMTRNRGAGSQANDNKPPIKPATPADLIVGFALGAVIGAATLYILFFR